MNNVAKTIELDFEVLPNYEDRDDNVLRLSWRYFNHVTRKHDSDVMFLYKRELTSEVARMTKALLNFDGVEDFKVCIRVICGVHTEYATV